jgi:hypothetical protein
MLARMAEQARPASERLLVSFEGDRTGSGPLSWGQHELWHLMRLTGGWLPVGTALPLPAGSTLDDAAADLRFAISSYPTMRTRLRLDPARPGHADQVVSGCGEIPLEVFDVEDGTDPAAAADRVWSAYADRDYDATTEWPVRMAVTRHRGQLTHRVWVMCHLVTDGFGSRVLIRERAARDASASRAAPTPLDQARWQHSPAGQRQCQAALRHWERLLRGVPAGRFPDRGERPHPRYRQAQFTSRALHLAVRAISARTGVEASSVLLTCYAVALSRVTGGRPVVVVLVVNNRFRPGLADSVSPLIQPGVCVIDLPDGTLDEAVAHTRRRAIAGYKYAYYHPARREELIARVNQERGEEVDLDCSFNDRRLKHRDQAGPPPTPDEIRAARPESGFEWTEQQDHRPYAGLYVYVDDVPDTVQLTAVADVHCVPPGDVEAVVRGMAEVAVAGALDPAARLLAGSARR